jgi:hypothetical protein
MLAIGYRVEMQAITSDIEKALRRNLTRGDDNISAYYAEHYRRAWLHDAATAALNPDVAYSAAELLTPVRWS